MKLTVVSGGAAQALVTSLADPFRASTALDIDATFGAVGAMIEKLVAGAPADLVILTAEAIADLEGRGLVVPGTATDIGIVHTGIAVRAGDPLPAIGTAAELRDALRAADAIYFPDPARATAGIHFAKVMRQLGVADELAPRFRTYPNGHAAMTAMAVQCGGRSIGCIQVTEILAVPRVEVAGLLPHEFELATLYTAAVATNAARPEEARKLAALLAGSEAAAERERAGFSA
jgi:molybdate transport system substrate-binding protein